MIPTIRVIFTDDTVMRGSDQRSGWLFSYVDLEARVQADHPPWPILDLVNAAPERPGAAFQGLSAGGLRPLKWSMP